MPCKYRQTHLPGCLDQLSSLARISWFSWKGATRLGHGGGEKALGVVVCSASSTNLGISGHSGGEPRTCDGLISFPRRRASSSGVGGGSMFFSCWF